MQFYQNHKFSLGTFILLICNLQNALGQTTSILGLNLANNVNVVNTAAPFLLIGPDARAGGIGDAGAASSPDANSIHWNPAKLAFIKDTLGFSASYTPWLRQVAPDINLAYLSWFYKLKHNQTIGGSISYFSLGQNTATSIIPPRNFNPNEYAIDYTYARQLSGKWSVGISAGYIYSNLIGTTIIPGIHNHSTNSFGVTLSCYYQGKEMNIGNAKIAFAWGACLSNIGPKMGYNDTMPEDFLPTNLRIGPNITIDLDNYNKLSFLFDLNKLLVPTPPVYEYINGIPAVGSNGQYIIAAGMNPNVNVPQGMIQSFYDAPGGAAEEFHEIDISGGAEYSYDNRFAFRSGFFYENPTKGGREYITLGAGFKLNIIHLDVSYLIPISQQNPLQNTLQITVGVYFR